MAPAIPHLEKLPSLTHLALRLGHSQALDASLLAIVAACKQLKVLVVFDESDNSEYTAWPADPRVVYMPYPSNVVREWEAQAKRDRPCSWSRAEDLVQKHIAERDRLCFPTIQWRQSQILMISIKQDLPPHSGSYTITAGVINKNSE